MDKTTGGPAFPAQEQIDYPSCSVTQHYPGMTLRDYFAAKVIATLWLEASDIECDDRHARSHALSMQAYEIADAMLAARSAP